MRIVKLWFTGLALFSLGIANAQFGPVPKELSENANAVVRLNEETFSIFSPKSATREVKRIVTVLNEHGNRWATLVIPYDDFSTVRYIEGTLYDKFGKRVRSLKRRDIVDQAQFSHSTLSDARLKIGDLEYNQYPYTVEFSYTVETSRMMFFEDWDPVLMKRTALERGKFTVQTPSAYELRYRTYNLDEPTKKSVTDGWEYTWNAENIQVVESDPLQEDFRERWPIVDLAPSMFVMQGYAGEMSSWQSLGNFIAVLNRGRNDLPEARKAEFRALVANETTREAKVKVLYEYLQQNTRYVSIQLGIGGWQPFLTSYVDQQGYGDCKALSYYMQAMLEAVGIPSYYTLVAAGREALMEELDPEFPQSTFNHVILAVPNEQDTLWLECTSQTNPFDYQGVFTGNREALMITDNGGVVVKTHHYGQDDNQFNTTAMVKVDTDGNAAIQLQASISGMNYSTSGVGVINSESREDQKEWLQSISGLSNLQTNNISFEYDRVGKNPIGRITANVDAKRVANVSGERIFINPNLFSQYDNSLVMMENRTSKMKLSYSYQHIDTVKIELPEGYYPEILPAGIQIESEFGSYEASYSFEEQGLLYIRKHARRDGIFPAEAYNRYVEFCKEIEKADRTKVVLVNRT